MTSMSLTAGAKQWIERITVTCSWSGDPHSDWRTRQSLHTHCSCCVSYCHSLPGSRQGSSRCRLNFRCLSLQSCQFFSSSAQSNRSRSAFKRLTWSNQPGKCCWLMSLRYWSLELSFQLQQLDSSSWRRYITVTHCLRSEERWTGLQGTLTGRSLRSCERLPSWIEVALRPLVRRRQ